MVIVGPPPPKPITQTLPLSTLSTDPFMNQMLTQYNNSSLTPPVVIDPFAMTQTENNSATHKKTNNPCLDLFFQVVPSTYSHTLESLLLKAWDHNPLTTLKLICNLRGVRGTGKSDKNNFYTAALWLHKLHPKTLACNLTSLADFGYFKDFPEILFKILGQTHVPKMPRGYSSRARRAPFARGRNKNKNNKNKRLAAKKKSMKTVKRKEINIREAKDRQVIEAKKAREARHKKKADVAELVVKKYKHDPDFRFLHDRVSDLFAEQLKADVEALHGGKGNKISLAAKWCPSLDSCFDRGTLLCEAIARKVFPKEDFIEYQDVEDSHYAYRVRDRLRKEVLAPLRAALELPEVYMGAKKWGEVKYTRVASVAMKTYKESFMKHDEERFNGYLEDVKNGKAKMAAGAVLPHEIVGSLDDDDGGEVAELQWKRVVDDMKKEGSLSNCIAVCDVSGSMEGTPLEVCVSLGLLVAELAEEPWKGKVITFSEKPTLHVVQGESLREKSKFIRSMDWGENTNFQRVFDIILEVAVMGKLEGDQLIKRVFVFSDMEFDKASTNRWETDYMMIQKKFEANGYAEYVPEMVFWNLRDSKSIPVSKNERGCALVSGFSKNAMKLFLAHGLDPEAVMESAIAGEEYQKLVVLD